MNHHPPRKVSEAHALLDRVSARKIELVDALERLATVMGAPTTEHSATIQCLVRYVGAVTLSWPGAAFLTSDQQMAHPELNALTVEPVSVIVPVEGRRQMIFVLTRLAVTLLRATRRVLDVPARGGALPARWWVRVPYLSLRITRRGQHFEVAAGLLVAHDAEPASEASEIDDIFEAATMPVPVPGKHAESSSSSSSSDSSSSHEDSEASFRNKSESDPSSVSQEAAADEAVPVPPAKRARPEPDQGVVPSIASAVSDQLKAQWVENIRTFMVTEASMCVTYEIENAASLTWIETMLVPHLTSAAVGFNVAVECQAGHTNCQKCARDHRTLFVALPPGVRE
jgi:hypothetical protein